MRGASFASPQFLIQWRTDPPRRTDSLRRDAPRIAASNPPRVRGQCSRVSTPCHLPEYTAPYSTSTSALRCIWPVRRAVCPKKEKYKPSQRHLSCYHAPLASRSLSPRLRPIPRWKRSGRQWLSRRMGCHAERPLSPGRSPFLRATYRTEGLAALGCHNLATRVPPS